MPRKKRDYAKEYREYHSRPEQRKRRSSRNKARRAMVNAGRAKPGDGMDVHHRDGNPMNNSRKNLKMVKRSRNRSKK